MAVLGLGLIAISLCFFIYKIPSKRWLEYIGPQQAIQSAEAFSEKKERFTDDSIDELSEKADLAAEISSVEESSTLKAQASDVDGPLSIPFLSIREAERVDMTESYNSTQKRSLRHAQPTTLPVISNNIRQDRSMPPPPMFHPSSTSLMPPPSVKVSALKPLPKLGGSLFPPPSAASALRGPQKISQNALGIPLSTSTLPPNKRPSRKVLLDPGHSPLDWANITRNPPSPSFLRGADVPPQLIKVTPTHLKKQNGRKGADAWGTYQGKVYNLTPYLKFHPGGVAELLRGAGKVGEAEKLFIEIHPWVNWDGMLSECLIGILTSEKTRGSEDLEAMD